SDVGSARQRPESPACRYLALCAPQGLPSLFRPPAVSSKSLRPKPLPFNPATVALACASAKSATDCPHRRSANAVGNQFPCEMLSDRSHGHVRSQGSGLGVHASSPVVVSDPRSEPVCMT